MTVCRTCGQPIDDFRLGVALTPTQVRIFDAVKAAGDNGIMSRELLQIVYEGRRNMPLQTVIKSHILMINEKLAETDYQIMAYHRRLWYLVKSSPSAPARRYYSTYGEKVK